LFVSGVSLIAGIASLLLPTRGSKLAAILVLGGTMLIFLAALALRDQKRRESAVNEGPESKSLAH
jgi:threonine/homoserine/homoserine lactone efflux protein